MHLDTLRTIQEKLHRMCHASGERIFHIANRDGQIVWTNGWGWTDGFWMGQLLLVGSLFEDKKLLQHADALMHLFDERFSESVTLDHDLGFLYLLSAAMHHNITGNTESLQRAMRAANILGERFNRQGKYIVAWNQWETDTPEFLAAKPGITIMDSLMNMPLLFFACKHTGNDALRDIANAHAATVAKHFFRSDGSTYHTFQFNPLTGEPLRGGTYQGYSDDTCWTRGHAWAIYGFYLMYANTKDRYFAEQSLRALSYWLEHIPDDGIPPWDFGAPNQELKDVSAALIACSGMIDLVESDVVDEPLRSRLTREVDRIVTTVLDHYLRDEHEFGITNGGVSDFPHDKGIDACLVYSDYFLVEVLLKLMKRRENLMWVV